MSVHKLTHSKFNTLIPKNFRMYTIYYRAIYIHMLSAVRTRFHTCRMPRLYACSVFNFTLTAESVVVDGLSTAYDGYE